MIDHLFALARDPRTPIEERRNAALKYIEMCGPACEFKVENISWRPDEGGGNRRLAQVLEQRSSEGWILVHIGDSGGSFTLVHKRPRAS